MCFKYQNTCNKLQICLNTKERIALTTESSTAARGIWSVKTCELAKRKCPEGAEASESVEERLQRSGLPLPVRCRWWAAAEATQATRTKGLEIQ